MNRPGYDLTRLIPMTVEQFTAMLRGLPLEGFSPKAVDAIRAASKFVTVDATGEKLFLAPQTWV